MKIGCECGEVISDTTDALPYKAHVVPDQEWFEILEAIDDAIENSGPTRADKEAACMKVRSLLGVRARLAWQCNACGRIYADDVKHVLQQFVPASATVVRELFRRK